MGRCYNQGRLCLHWQGLVVKVVDGLIEVSRFNFSRAHRMTVVRQFEAPVKRMLDDQRRLFESLFCVFLENSLVMVLGLVTALNHHGDEGLELAPCVTGIVDVCLGLSTGFISILEKWGVRRSGVKADVPSDPC